MFKSIGLNTRRTRSHGHGHGQGSGIGNGNGNVNGHGNGNGNGSGNADQNNNKENDKAGTRFPLKDTTNLNLNLDLSSSLSGSGSGSGNFSSSIFKRPKTHRNSLYARIYDNNKLNSVFGITPAREKAKRAVAAVTPSREKAERQISVLNNNTSNSTASSSSSLPGRVTPARQHAQEKIKEMILVGEEGRITRLQKRQRKAEEKLEEENKKLEEENKIQELQINECGETGTEVVEAEEEENISFSCDTSLQLDAKPEEHRFYGKLLHDFEYKKMYACKARAFCSNVPIWHLQRPLDQDRVKCISDTKTDKKFLGVISVFEYEGLEHPGLDIPQVRGIFDGQHRSAAINRMLKADESLDFDISIEVYPVTSEEEIKSLFLEVNKAVTVQEIDLPSNIAPKARKLIDVACFQLKNKYPNMFGGPTCRCPNIFVDNLRNALFKAEIVEKLETKSSESLVKVIEDKNRELSKLKDSQWPKKVRRNLKKAKENSFFLGLDTTWVEELADDLLAAAQGQ